MQNCSWMSFKHGVESREPRPIGSRGICSLNDLQEWLLDCDSITTHHCNHLFSFHLFSIRANLLSNLTVSMATQLTLPGVLSREFQTRVRAHLNNVSWNYPLLNNDFTLLKKIFGNQSIRGVQSRLSQTNLWIDCRAISPNKPTERGPTQSKRFLFSTRFLAGGLAWYLDERWLARPVSYCEVIGWVGILLRDDWIGHMHTATMWEIGSCWCMHTQLNSALCLSV